MLTMRSAGGGGATGAGIAAGAGAGGGGAVAACCGGGCTQPNSKPDNNTAAIFPFIALLPFATEFRYCYSRRLTVFRGQEPTNLGAAQAGRLHFTAFYWRNRLAPHDRHPAPAAPRMTAQTRQVPHGCRSDGRKQEMRSWFFALRFEYPKFT
jgi:hypothetical protein